jgi:alpha-beta hydrolase superfamily lysophospholipase
MNTQASEHTFIFSAFDDQQIFCRRWPIENPKAIVQFVHGGSEHSERYTPLARSFNQRGYAVYSQDNRGHGKTGEINGKLGDMGPANAFERVCEDVLALTERARAENPGLPIVLLGHSLGSLITQRILLQHSGQYTAAVLSGSPDIYSVANAADLVSAEVDRVGRDQVSNILEAGILEGFNAVFPDAATAYDWLSRDTEQVQLYIDDPWCGPPLCAGAWQDLIAAMLVTAEPAAVKSVRKDLPLYILSGEADPVHSNWQAIERLVEIYRGADLTDIEVKSYPGGRHEMFNETNRDEVISELLAWVDSRLS